MIGEEKGKELDKAEALLQGEIDHAWDAFLKTPAGKLIIWDIMQMCMIYQSTFTGNSNSNFHEGERHIGLRILNERILPIAGTSCYADILVEADQRLERLRIAAAIDEKNEETE